MPPITRFSQLDLSKRYTYADYLTWQFDELVELIKGRVFRMSAAPQSAHQTISFNLNTSIGIDRKGCLGIPDWIIEILSPGNPSHDTKNKFDLYEESGVGEYWIVFPGEQTVSVFLLENGRYQSRGDYHTPGAIPVHTLPGTTIEWTEVFENVDQ